MNLIEKILYCLQSKMNTPKPFRWFHLFYACSNCILIFKAKKNNNKQLKIVLDTYSIIALILEILKQIIWTFNYALHLYMYF